MNQRNVPDPTPTLKRVLFSALAALTVGLAAISLLSGFSGSFGLRLLQAVAVFGAGALLLGGSVVLVMVHLAGWRQPESEFEDLVRRSERLAVEDPWRDVEDHDDDIVDDDDGFDLS